MNPTCTPQARDQQQAVHNFIDDLLKGLGFQQCKDDAGLYFWIAGGSVGMDIGWSSSMVPITRAPAIRALARDYAITKTTATPYHACRRQIVGRTDFIHR